jgi:glucokinase
VLLAGDVGATKTVLALYDSDDVRAPTAVRSYDSRAAQSLESMLDDFLSCEATPHAASLAVAGPVVDGFVRVTNLPWVVSARELSSRYGFARTDLLNDVEALGWAIAALHPNELETLQEGDPSPGGPMALLALGTGLGEGYVTGSRPQRIVHASEGGHADLAPANPLQSRLLASLWRDFEHVSVERACSGSGLPRIYRFLVGDEGRDGDPDVEREIAAAADPTPAIVLAAVEGRCEACQEAICLLCDLLAAEAGNLALKILATGGVYLGGGLAPRLLPFLRSTRFSEAFLAKGRFASLLRTLPLRVILASEAVLWGAALRGKPLD